MVDFDIVKSMEHYYKYLKYRTTEINGTSPLTFKSNGRPLRNYRIYGNTVNGESVGNMVTEGEHAGEYCVPIMIEGINLFNKANVINGYYKPNGELALTQPENAWVHSDYIPVVSGETYIASNTSIGGQGTAHLILDNEKRIIETIPQTANTNTILNIPINGKYVVLSVRRLQNEDQTTMLTKGSLPPEIYEPYYEPITISIYLSQPLHKCVENMDYLDYHSQKRFNCNGTVKTVNLPGITPNIGINTITVNTDIKPSLVKVKPDN